VTEISARQRDFFDRQVVSLITMKYGMEDMKAIRSFFVLGNLPDATGSIDRGIYL